MGDWDPEDDDPGDVTCDFCGEPAAINGQDYIALACIWVCDATGRSIFFSPCQDPATVHDWGDLDATKILHLNCVANFFIGIHASIPVRAQEHDRDHG